MLKLNPRTALAFMHDVVAAAVTWIIAFGLRFNLDVPQYYLAIMLESLVWVVALQAAIFWIFGLYRGLWRYASLPDLKRIVSAVIVAALALPALFLMLRMSVPRSVLIFDPILLVMIMGGSRFAYRVWKEQGFSAITQGEPVIIIGADETAVTLLKELARNPQWRAAGVFDDDATKAGRQLQGVRILGTLKDVPRYIERLSVRHAIIAMPAASHTLRRRAVKICTDAGLQVMTVPSYDDLVNGTVTVSQIRHVELDDLLGRDPVVLDTAGLREWINGRVIMVTGAGGSIGSELCRQIARFKPRALVLFELNEFALYGIEQEFRRMHAAIPLVCAIGDVKDQLRAHDTLDVEPVNYLLHVRQHLAGKLQFAEAERAAATGRAKPAEKEAEQLPERVEAEAARHHRIVLEMAAEKPQVRLHIEFGPNQPLAVFPAVFADFADAVEHQHRR